MLMHERKSSRSLIFPSLLYLLTLGLSLYFLFLSRREEVLTVWGVIHPAFIPTFIVSTFMLLILVFTDLAVPFKLVFTILHSLLVHSLFVIIFPAGNLGVQQTILGESRLVFDNIILHGFGSSRQGLPLIIYVSFRGESLQTAFSVIFARMLAVDVYWTHLLLVPVLWGTFVPVIAFLISKTLGANDKISALSSVVVTLFPTTILWGAVSLPNGLSYMFFFCFVLFLIRYIKRGGMVRFLLVATFMLASFMSHFLAGTVAFSLFLLAYSVKTYIQEKPRTNRFNTKPLLLFSFFVITMILPFALVLRRFFYPTANTQFSLQALHTLPATEFISYLLLGGYFDLISREAYITAFTFGVPSLVAILILLYILIQGYRKKPHGNLDPLTLFFFLGALMIAAEDRIVKLFLINAPFVEADRLWVFRDLLLIPFLALFVAGIIWETQVFFNRVSRGTFSAWRQAPVNHSFRPLSFFVRGHLAKGVSIGSVITFMLILIIVSGWVNASVFYAYPHWAPLQTTSYELEAVKYIKETTQEKYIVVGDQWIIFAGQMIAGIRNPNGFYFPSTDPRWH